MISVVASLPLVALVNAVIPGRQQVTQIEYVVALLVLALTVGYGLAAARGTRPVERLLARVGYRIQAEGSIYAQTLKHMSAEATVVVECTTDDKSGAALAAGHRTRTTASTNSIWSIRAPGLTGSGSRLAKVSSCRSLRSARSLCPRSRLARPFRHDRTTLSPPHRRLRLRRRALRDQRAARGRRLLPLHALSAPHRHGDAGLSQDRAGLVLATAGEEHLRAWSPPGGLDKVFRGEGGPALSGRDPDTTSSSPTRRRGSRYPTTACPASTSGSRARRAVGRLAWLRRPPHASAGCASPGRAPRLPRSGPGRARD